MGGVTQPEKAETDEIMRGVVHGAQEQGRSG